MKQAIKKYSSWLIMAAILMAPALPAFATEPVFVNFYGEWQPGPFPVAAFDDMPNVEGQCTSSTHPERGTTGYVEMYTATDGAPYAAEWVEDDGVPSPDTQWRAVVKCGYTCPEGDMDGDCLLTDEDGDGYYE